MCGYATVPVGRSFRVAQSRVWAHPTRCRRCDAASRFDRPPKNTAEEAFHSWQGVSGDISFDPKGDVRNWNRCHLLVLYSKEDVSIPNQTELSKSTQKIATSIGTRHAICNTSPIFSIGKVLGEAIYAKHNHKSKGE